MNLDRFETEPRNRRIFILPQLTADGQPEPLAQTVQRRDAVRPSNKERRASITSRHAAETDARILSLLQGGLWVKFGDIAKAVPDLTTDRVYRALALAVKAGTVERSARRCWTSRPMREYRKRDGKLGVVTVSRPRPDDTEPSQTLRDRPNH